LITLSRKFLALREDLRFGLDKVFYRLRRLLLAIGQHDQLKLMREFKDSIFFLELNELRGLLNQEVAIDDFVSLVRTRMSDYDNCQNQSPPYYLKITGNDVISLEHAECKGMTIQGVAASPGVAEGTARVIYSDKEFYKLKRGDILIAHNTDPGWTPLFLAISGIVVEIGGILNHCAIVAREYNIPAVVGIVNVTKQINDGQRVRVNGNTGTVEILEP
jgi:pyruvate,water dikinase